MGKKNKRKIKYTHKEEEQGKKVLLGIAVTAIVLAIIIIALSALW